MFEKIENYMNLSIEERQKHIDLNMGCIEIGGINSTYYTGLLAHYLKTTIPTRLNNISLCHACGNSTCSNPNHLYWGTFGENENDKKIHGTFKNVREKTISKYGIKEANEIYKKASAKGGINGGGSNRLSEEEIQRRREIISDIDPNSYGCITKIAKRLNISHTQAKRFLKI